MGIIKYTEQERNLLARIMRAEAIGEGNLGMLLVGNVVINRILANCFIFNNINTVKDAIYQKNQFSGINNSIFFSNPTSKEKYLANRIFKGEYFNPATNSLWFYASKDNNCKKTWYEQELAGKFKNHCFYQAINDDCRKLH